MKISSNCQRTKQMLKNEKINYRNTNNLHGFSSHSNSDLLMFCSLSVILLLHEGYTVQTIIYQVKNGNCKKCVVVKTCRLD